MSFPKISGRTLKAGKLVGYSQYSICGIFLFFIFLRGQ